jgi:putative hydrolase of the HAD superfamily
MDGQVVLLGVAFDLGSTLIWFDGQWEKALDEGIDELIRAGQALGWNLDWEELREALRQGFLGRASGRQVDPIERPTAGILKRALQQVGFRDYDSSTLRAALRAFYRPSEERWKPLPEAAQVLTALRNAGYRLALISNAGDGENVRRLMRKCGLNGFFDPVLISAEFGLRKPASAIFRALLDSWGVDPQQVVMVGDRLVEDVLGSQRVGMRQIWVRRYAEPGQPMEGEIRPDFILDNLAQVPQCVAAMEGERS